MAGKSNNLAVSIRNDFKNTEPIIHWTDKKDEHLLTEKPGIEVHWLPDTQSPSGHL